MSDDADEIRRKRLQRLGGNTSNTNVNSNSNSITNSGSSGFVKADTKSTISSITNDKPSTGNNSVTSSTTKPNITSTPISTPTKIPSPSTTPISNKKVISFDEWQHKTIQDVLQVSLTQGTEHFYLQSLDEEFKAENNSNPLLTSDHLDQIFWSRLTEQKCLPSVFDYLLSAWSRVASAKRLLKSSTPDYDLKLSLLSEIQRFTIDFAVISGTADPLDSEIYSNIGERLVSKANSNRSPIPWEFIEAIIIHSEEQELLPTLLTNIFSHLSTSLARKLYPTVQDTDILDYRPHFTIIENLISIKSVPKILTELENFSITEKNIVKPTTPSHNTEQYQITVNTILGPFLAISPIDAPFCFNSFPNPDILSQSEIDRIAIDIRAELKVIQDRLFFICDKIVRSSPSSRQKLLEYFGKILDLNHKRTAMRVDPKQVSPNGFMMNISYILTKFSQPFSDLYGSKLDKISKDYFCNNPVFDISDETKLINDNQLSAEYYEKNKSNVNINFITHCFFLTNAFYQYGINGSIQSLSRLKNIVEDLKHHIARIEAEIPKYANTPRIEFVRKALDNAKIQLKQAQAIRISTQCVLFDMDQQVIYLELALFQLMFVIHCASESYPANGNLNLPFNGEPQEFFKNYPEYLIEAPISLLLYISRYIPHVLARNPYSQLVTFCIAFLSNTNYIKNPYLKAKLVEVLFYGSIDYQNGQRGYFVNIFDSDPLCHKYLLHSMMNFYIEVEQTGASSQFYDKFNTRYYISQIIKCIWANNIYRSNLAKESEEDVDFFVHFVALLLNDATYLFDESLTKLGEIHKLQKELPTIADANEDQETQEKRSQLEQAEKHASSYMQLTNQTVLLLNLFTSAVAKAFVTPEIVDRFAAMLNYNLAALVGPKCRELKVQDPQKYGFNPRELLSRLVDVYLNLHKEESFIKALARDGRSYNGSNFDRAISILSKWALKTPKELQSLKELKESADIVKQEDEQGDLELGEIPDEFLDPLMYTLMDQPVILPSSKVTIDLGTIKSHLLSDAKDPFNRAPLKIEEVIPNNELKEKIEAFKKERREKYLSGKMDTSE